MVDSDLLAKEAYFREQDLLDISDDEHEMCKSFDIIEQTREHGIPPPSSLARNPSSFLGPTPKELLAKFEAHTTRQRASGRRGAQRLERSITAPKSDLSKEILLTGSQDDLPSETSSKRGKKTKKLSSLPVTPVKAQAPFYQRMGDIPRELKHGKNAKNATKIKLLPVHKQLFKDKVVYFYPNNDISMVQRMRIHKMIELGAAWIKSWRDDVTHVILDDECHTYTQLLEHLKMDKLPDNVVLIKYEPYVPQCMQFGRLLDPSSHRFIIRDGPARKQATEAVKTTQVSTSSQTSLAVKRSRQQVIAQESQKTGGHPTDKGLAQAHLINEIKTHTFDNRVKDSYTISSSDPSCRKTGDHFNDALSLAIQEAKALAHLPLEEDEDGEFPTTDTMGDTEESETDEEPLEAVPKHPEKPRFVSKASALRDKGALNLSTFQCMNPGASSSTPKNPNARTIQILEEMCKHYDQMQDQWRTLAYRKGIATLKKQTDKITTARQAGALPFIGQRLADKIEEIVLTDRLRKLDNTRDDPLDAVLRLFLGVYGAGLVQANKWIQAGHRTLDDLLHTKAKLTESQKVGIEHYTDFSTRIPRPEVEAHGAFVKTALRDIDPAYEATIMGSYRRGAIDSGDIDMIITCAGAPLRAIRSVVFDTLVPRLFAAGFLKVALATSRSSDDDDDSSSGSKWHGASCLPSSGTWRRMDLLIVPEQEMGAALLYFTGNDIFNRSIRLLARKRHMRLNQRGLYKDVKRGPRGQKLNQGVLVEGRCERRIFEILGVPWWEPHERVC